MAEEATRSEEQAQADDFAENSVARHPVIAAAEEKLEAMARGERVDVAKHQAIRQRHLGDGALTPEQRMTGVLGDEDRREGTAEDAGKADLG